MRIIDSNTVELSLAYTEPTRDSDSTPANPLDNPLLTDLSYTSVFYRIGTAPQVAAGNTPATATSGGGNVTRLLIVPAPVNQKTTVEFWATSTDITGNTAGDIRSTFVVDRMAPLPPSNFTVA